MTAQASPQLLQDFDAAHFMQKYWQRKPLLIRNVFDITAPPLSKETLGGLACEEDVISRIVQEHHADGPWKLDIGPFDTAFFATLPDSHWTLLVSDCEKHLPALQPLIEPFRFIPDWRIDDLMISYAVDGGSVGPHTDDYDVFLIQLDGVREWQINSHINHADIIDGIDLRILRSFHPEQSWLLKPGDLLYLPPRVAHYGIARGECMTASVGFRAASWREIMHGYLEEIIMRIPEDLRYSDSGTPPQQHPAEILPDAITRFRTIIEDNIQLDDAAFQSWVGKFVTEPKTEGYIDSTPPEMTPEAFSTALHHGQRLTRHPHVSCAWTRSHQTATLFVNGQAWELPIRLLPDIQRLSEEGSTAGDAYDTEFHNVLYELYLAEAVAYDND